MNYDSIQIKDLEVYCHHGVLKEETVLGQKFLVSLVLYTDTRQAGASDDLVFSINYAEVSHFVKKKMETHNYKLIEAVAAHLADELLAEFPLIHEVEVEIKKPWAPILLPLDTVSVKIRRGWHVAYLSIGSNMGDKKAHLDEAVESLKKCLSIRKVRTSSWIETEPYGYTEQDMFLNGAIELETTLGADELLHLLWEIEKEGKRERVIHWGPRTIDLDLILYDNAVIQTEELTVPHREMHKREFVLKPLCEIAPWAMHPVYHRTAAELLEELQKKVDAE